MRQRLRSHLTYANVMATVAVFLALGGGAYAAFHLKKNSVGPRQLKNNAVSTKKLRDGAVTTAKIANNAVNGTRIADGSIGIADVSASLHLLCRSGTSYVQGACVQNSPSAATGWTSAASSCKDLGGRLPSPAELFTLAARGGSGLVAEPGEWTNSVSFDGPNFLAQVVGSGPDAAVGNVDTNSQPYRCVFDPTG
jgi:hypothetical protein